MELILKPIEKKVVISIEIINALRTWTEHPSGIRNFNVQYNTLFEIFLQIILHY